LKASGVELLDIREIASCRVGLPRWRESSERRARRARQDLRIFERLDHAGLVIVPNEDVPDLFAWEARLTREGYESVNHRVGDRAILNLYFRSRKKTIDAGAYDAMDAAANEIGTLLKR
jgi:hypothetical protein